MGPHPAVAAVRAAVRRSLDGLAGRELVLAACSGGADSLALAAALAHEAPRAALRAGAVTVDHGLQPGSAQRAAEVASVLTGLGLAPVTVVAVTVAGRGGPEAAARAARYQGLAEAAASSGAAAVLLGHTLDDQAETVLLGLARGSGTRSLAGMPARRGVFRRPLLELTRDTNSAACRALGLAPWEDPHNRDPAFARSRVRHEVMPVLEAALGPGVARALARSAKQFQQDAGALDELAAATLHALGELADGWPVDRLAATSPAIRARVLRLAALRAGCPAGALTAGHIGELDALVTGWHGQRWIDLPGGVRGRRRYGKLLFTVGRQQARPGRSDAEDLVGSQ